MMMIDTNLYLGSNIDN